MGDTWTLFHLVHLSSKSRPRSSGIESVRIRAFPIISGICFRIILSHSETIRKICCTSFDEKRSNNKSDLIIFNPSYWSQLIQTKFSIRVNPNQSKLRLISTEFLICINSKESDSFRLRIYLDWEFGLYQSELRLIRIDNVVWINVSDWIRIKRIKSDGFSTFSVIFCFLLFYMVQLIHIEFPLSFGIKLN